MTGRLMTRGWFARRLMTRGWFARRLMTRGWFARRLMTRGWFARRLMTRGLVCAPSHDARLLRRIVDDVVGRADAGGGGVVRRR